jgi:ATP-binding cassette, subfamily A (ABC1), member 3
MFVQPFAYFSLYLYLDNVIPNAFGVSKSIFYCLNCRTREEEAIEREIAITNLVIPSTDERLSLNNEHQNQFENEAQLADDGVCNFNERDPIRLVDLTKKFGKFTAVDKMTLSIKGNEVFTFLGHNGAGKTTAIYMLTGMLKASSGNATLYNNTVQSDIDEVRKNLGLCQQFDVLYNELTVYEHLMLTCRIKEVGHETERDIRETLELVMLTQHKDKKPTELSGGMKRKLSLAMALIGKSRTIILDEPTSGLDVESRRQVWELILKIRETRSIIMSTQHIEEADVLSNRICVMSHGKIIALDTPNNIKRRFGVGYNIMMESKNVN